jgi:hypothetical protein
MEFVGSLSRHGGDGDKTVRGAPLGKMCPVGLMDAQGGRGRRSTRQNLGRRLRICRDGLTGLPSGRRISADRAAGEAIQIKASKKVGFRPAKELKEAI